MADLFDRFAGNPILTPDNVPASRPDWEVAGVLNPGAFTFGGRTGLLMRVAERPPREAGWLGTPILDAQADGGVRLFRVRRDDADLIADDPRVFTYRGATYLTTLSHLRLAWSDDGINFTPEAQPALIGRGDHETFGIEDCRVTQIDQTYHLTYTAVSAFGVGVSRSTTTDWKRFEHHPLVLPPHNKDCALFERQVGERYAMLHRPSGAGLGGNFIWYAESDDLTHWGKHRCLATTRRGRWDSSRIGAGAAPIETPDAWLVLYHGADDDSRYCLGTMLLDLGEPWRVIGRCDEPVMEPLQRYEQEGFFGNVVFTNGHVIDGDRITVYYGASDELIGGATGSISELLATAQRM